MLPAKSIAVQLGNGDWAAGGWDVHFVIFLAEYGVILVDSVKRSFLELSWLPLMDDAPGGFLGLWFAAKTIFILFNL